MYAVRRCLIAERMTEHSPSLCILAVRGSSFEPQSVKHTLYNQRFLFRERET